MSAQPDLEKSKFGQGHLEFLWSIQQTMCSSLSIAVPVGVFQCSFLSPGTWVPLLKLANDYEACKLFRYCGGNTFSSPSSYENKLFGVVEEE